MRAARIGGIERLVDQVRECLDHAVAGGARGVERLFTLEEPAARHVHREHGNVIDVELGANRDHPTTVELDEGGWPTSPGRGR